jgi:DNA-binding GntR family transcriptional regulator
VRRIPRQSLRDLVLNTLRDAVIQGEFAPGQKVPEDELAAQLGVSRTPVREALRILEYQGLVETHPKKGTYVTKMEPQDVLDGLLVRCSLEELAVREAIPRLGSAWQRTCDGLQALLDEMHDACMSGDPVATTEFDIRWHAALLNSAGNRHLTHAWNTVGAPLMIWTPEAAIYPIPEASWRAMVSRHAKLLEVFRTGDVDASIDALRQHILLRQVADGS